MTRSVSCRASPDSTVSPSQAVSQGRSWQMHMRRTVKWELASIPAPRTLDSRSESGMTGILWLRLTPQPAGRTGHGGLYVAIGPTSTGAWGRVFARMSITHKRERSAVVPELAG